jgi:hypothetical protein
MVQYPGEMGQNGVFHLVCTVFLFIMLQSQESQNDENTILHTEASRVCASAREHPLA